MTWSATLSDFAKKHWKFILVASAASAAVGAYSVYSMRSASTRHAKKKLVPPTTPQATSNDVDDIIHEAQHIAALEHVDKYVATSKGNEIVTEEADDQRLDKAVSEDVDYSQLSEEERDKMALSAKTRGNKYFSAQKYDKAIAMYTKALDLYAPSDKRCAVYFSNRAACWANMNEFDKVIEDANAALAADASYVKAMIRRGNAYEKKSMFTEALEDLTTACVLEEFKTESTVFAADRSLKALVAIRAKEIFATLKHEDLPSISFVTAYLNSFHYDYVSSGEAAEINPGSGDALFYKASKAFAKKEWEKAEKLCLAALKASPQKFMARALNMRGTFSFLKGCSDSAKEDFEESIRLDSTIVNTHIKMANLVMEQKLEAGLAESMDFFAKAEAMEPDNADIYYHRGQIHFLVQKYDSALNDYGKALSLNPNFVLAKVQLAIVNYRMENTEVASQMFEAAQRQFPESADVFYYQGETLLDQQRIEDAMALFDRAIEINPSAPLPYLNKGIIFFHVLGNIERAMEFTQKAIEVDSRCDLAFSHLAQMYMHQGRLDEAIIIYKKAIDLARTLTDVETGIMGLEAVRAQSVALQRLRVMKRLN